MEGIDRYGRPTGYTQTSPYTQTPTSPTSAPSQYSSTSQTNYANQQNRTTANAPSASGTPTQSSYAPQPQQTQFQQSSAPASYGGQPTASTQPYGTPVPFSGNYTAQTPQQNYGGQPTSSPTPSSPYGSTPSYVPSGFDATKWNDPTKHDPKYDIGRILAGLSPNGQISGTQVQGALSQIQKLYPGTTFDGKDVLNIPGFGPIDIIQGASAGGGTGALQWLVPGGGSGGPAVGGVQQGMTAAPIPSAGGVNVGTGSGPYHAGTLPTTALPTYNPASISQFNAPNQSGIDTRQQQMIQSLLDNPYSLNDQVVAQMKGSQQDQSALMQQQLAHQITSGAAQRGTLQGGTTGGALAQSQADANSHLLDSYRGIDITKATQDRQDLIQALQSAEGFQQGQMGRAVSGYNAGLAGQNAQADQGYKGFQSQSEAVQFALQQALQQEGLKQVQGGQSLDAQRNAITQALGNQDNAYHLSALQEQARQFNAGNQLDWAQFGEGSRQFNDQLGLSTAQLGLNSNLGYINSLLGGG